MSDSIFKQLKEIADKYKVQIDITVSSDSPDNEFMAWNNIGKEPYINASEKRPTSGVMIDAHGDNLVVNVAEEVVVSVSEERSKNGISI